VKEECLLLEILKNRRHSWIWRKIRHSKFVGNILEGEVSGKNAVGNSQLKYLKEVDKNTKADSYTAMKNMACDIFRRKIATKLENRRKRRIRKK